MSHFKIVLHIVKGKNIFRVLSACAKKSSYVHIMTVFLDPACKTLKHCKNYPKPKKIMSGARRCKGFGNDRTLEEVMVEKALSSFLENDGEKCLEVCKTGVPYGIGIPS
ncbi:MAG: hypothetical protein JRJ85_08765 [Deltaproteobacteria bacterium]|nr:hypothetical protein [Deltaproteobacteria bacterium]